MSVAKKEEVCSHQLGLRLGEPAVGMPIKKRPVLLMDKSIASGMPLSLKPSSTATGMSLSGAAAGCSKELFLNISDTNVISKCNGITNSLDQNHAKRSLTLPVAVNEAVFANGSTQIPCEESGQGSIAPVARSQSQKFLPSDLQLASCQNTNVKYSSPVKREILDQGISAFLSEPRMDVQTTSVMESSNSSLGKLSSLDLNVPLDPVDHLEGLPKVHEGCNELHHRTFLRQKAQIHEVTPSPTIGSGLGMNIDSALNLTDAYESSNKRGTVDVTLDLQLKPPTRPELGINWKELTVHPELSLSLFGSHTDEPKDLRVPDGLFRSETVGSAKKIIQGVATPGSDKSPVKTILKPVPCNVDMTMPSIVSGNVEMVSSSLVKKESEETSRQHSEHNIEKPLSEQQSVKLVSDCAELTKNDNINQVCGKASFDFNSDKNPKNNISNGLEVLTGSVVQTNRLCDVVTENVPTVSDVQKSIKCEEITTDIPNPVIATLTGHSVPLITESLLSKGNAVCPAVGLCEPASQPIICTSEPECCNPVDATTGCEQTVSHIHEVVTCKTSDAKACVVSRSSSDTTRSLVFNYRDCAAFDGMSQGSASMDCSDDGDNGVSQLPTRNKPLAGCLGNSQITEFNNLCTELPKEHGNCMRQYCSSVTNQVHLQGIDDYKHVTPIDGVTTHSGENHDIEVSVNGQIKDKCLLTSDKDSPVYSENSRVNNTDVAMQDVKIAMAAGSTDLRRSPALGTSVSPEIDSTNKSHETLDYCIEKFRISLIKSERSKSPHGKQTGNCSKANAKIMHGVQNEETAEVSNLHPKNSVLGEDSHLDVSSTSQPHDEGTQVNSSCVRSVHEKSKPDSCMTSSVQNEKDGQVGGSQWQHVSNAFVNRNERWERLMECERENKGEDHGGRHASDIMNQRRIDHRYGGRGNGYHGHPRNFRDPRMRNEAESDRRHKRPFKYDHEHFHQHRRWCSPPDCQMRDMDHDRFPGQMEDIPDAMMEESFLIPHFHPQHALGDRALIRRERIHSPGLRRGAPLHFQRGRSPEAMHRSTDRPYLPHQRSTQRHDAPFDRIEHVERSAQRNMRRCDVTTEDDVFAPPLHPAHLAKLHADADRSERIKFGGRRVYRRYLEESPIRDEKEMFAYHGEGHMDFPEDGGGPHEPDGRFRNKLERRGRVEEEDGYRYRGPQRWRDSNSDDSRAKRRNCRSYE